MFARPCNTVRELGQMPFSSPCALRLEPACGKRSHAMDVELLLLDHGIDEPVGPREPVRPGEDLDPASPIRWRRVGAPTDRLLVVAERYRVLQGVCDVRHRIARPREIEVE